MRHPIEDEAARLRAWLAEGPPDERVADDYSAWDRVYTAVWQLMRLPPPAWTTAQCDALIYVLGCDHMGQHVVDIVTEDAEAFLTVARVAALSADHDAKWQVAAALPAFRDEAGSEGLLLDLVRDETEYVQRRALLALAELGHGDTERLAVEHWRAHESDDEHARIGALAALERIGSPLCEEYVRLALADGRTYLCRYALKMGQH